MVVQRSRLAHRAPAALVVAGATKRKLISLRIRSMPEGEGEGEHASQGVFNSQFLGVLQQSLARQGADALTSGAAREEEDRATAVEEILSAALGQSKQSLQQLQVWKNQIEAQIAAQEKQVSRMEFALNKARNDAAYMKSLKRMLYDSAEE